MNVLYRIDHKNAKRMSVMQERERTYARGTCPGHRLMHKRVRVRVRLFRSVQNALGAKSRALAITAEYRVGKDSQWSAIN